MTLKDLESLETDVLTPAIVSQILRVNPQSIRIQAFEAPERLGFPVIIVGNRVLVPREGFINCMKGETKRPAAGTADQVSPNQRGERTKS